jgi:hypothetical protein
MSDKPLSPACSGCREPKGTCFPGPCKRCVANRDMAPIAAAAWRLNQCRKTVREGEEELAKRREALRQAQIAYEAVRAEEIR